MTCLPLRRGNRVLGVLQLENSRLNLLASRSLPLLRVLCDYAAIAVENVRKVHVNEELSEAELSELKDYLKTLVAEQGRTTETLVATQGRMMRHGH